MLKPYAIAALSLLTLLTSCQPHTPARPAAANALIPPPRLPSLSPALQQLVIAYRKADHFPHREQALGLLVQRQGLNKPVTAYLFFTVHYAEAKDYVPTAISYVQGQPVFLYTGLETVVQPDTALLRRYAHALASVFPHQSKGGAYELSCDGPLPWRIQLGDSITVTKDCCLEIVEPQAPPPYFSKKQTK